MEEKEPLKKKNNFCLFLLIIAILFIGIGIGLLISKTFVGDNKNNKESGNSTENNNKEIVNNTITREEAGTFLNELNDLLFVDYNDEYVEQRIFYLCISYLVENNKYTKDGDRLVFKESDIKDLLRKYYMRESVKYESEGMNVIYNQSNKTLSVSIGISLARDVALDGGPIPTYNIENFNFSNGVADLKYDKYKIKLVKFDGELRIKEITPIISENINIKELEEMRATLDNDIENNNYRAYVVSCSELGNGEIKNEYREVSFNTINMIIYKLKSAKQMKKGSPVGYVGTCTPRKVEYVITNTEKSLEGKKFIIMYSTIDNVLNIGYDGTPYDFIFENSSEINNFIENL